MSLNKNQWNYPIIPANYTVTKTIKFSIDCCKLCKASPYFPNINCEGCDPPKHMFMFSKHYRKDLK